MKVEVTAFIALAAIARAQPHQHVHKHAHAHAKRHVVGKRSVVEQSVAVTVVECWLGDHVLSEAECKQGIADGSLKWADDGSVSAATTAKMQAQPTSSVIAHPVAPPVASSVAPAAASPSVVAPPVQNKVQDTSSSSNAAAVNRAFPDGEIDCSTFPSDYGAVPVDWLNLGGWASVQKPNVVEVSGFNDILTVTKNECQGDNCCLEGAFCSYACPEGYMKYQWPSTQGATGQSVGGLQCKNGKLHLTNPSINTLCATGTNNVNVWIENRLSKNVAICRTNYPGDENMSIPVDAQPGSKKKLACPDSATYYRWQNKGTSAQYYLNLPGYSVDKACRWGKPGDDFGNWAPANLGVGWTDGRAWLSVFANHPTQTQVTLPYTVEIVGGNTKCRYKNGQYCGGDNYSTCSTEGCTVSAEGGDVQYILSDD